TFEKANIPTVLGREPLAATFFVLIAPFLFPLFFSEIAIAILSEEARADRTNLFIMYCVSGITLFAVASFWSERIGAGAFAGPLRATQNWYVAAACLGPVILFVSGLLMASLSGFEEGWQFRNPEYAATLSLTNIPLSLIVYALLVAPFVEEILYRGIGIGALMARGAGPIIAIGLTSLAFTLLHVQYSPAGMAAVFMAAVGFGWLRIASGSVGVAIFAHVSANGFQILLQYLAAQAPAT
ncbi:MAG: CPBP family intramembrane glutamic endopeptidase, partial [Pseudomonadota bacterium]